MLPAKIGPYRIEARLGEGGMGVVYRATGPDGPVALKVLRAALATEAFRSRFDREALIRIADDNVARVLDAGEDDQGTAYIAFELLEGESLADVFARGRPPLVDLVDWGAQAARGLSAVHAADVVHRDVKPGNLFLEKSGRLKVLDFGVARVVDDRTRLTRTGAVPGTVGYLSPEQAQGHVDVDPRSDQWALAAVLYEGISGAPPFARATPLATIVATLMEELAPLGGRGEPVPPQLADVVHRALRRNPAERFPSMDAFADALEAADLRVPTDAEAKRASSMQPGERRVIAFLLAVGVEDASRIAEAAKRERGTFLTLAGRRALAVFGEAAWEGDEVARAASAALAARDAAEAVAVATGWATSTGLGFSGDAVDAAERCAEAHLAGVALDSEAARHLSDTHTVERVSSGLFELRRGAPTTGAAALPLFDREGEVAQLRQAYDAVVGDHRAEVTLVEGPLGIGKGRLLDEARRIAGSRADARVVSVAATAGISGSDLGLARRLIMRVADLDDASDAHAALRRALGAAIDARPVALAHAEALADLITATETSASGAANDIVWARDRSRLALLEWLGALASKAPLVLAIGDLHWCDDATLELLEDLVDACEEQPLWLLASIRPELAPWNEAPFSLVGARTLRPRALTRRGTRALAASIAGREVNEALVARLHERSAGNPYFVIQSVRALGEEDQLDASAESLPLPVTVEAAVQSRLDHLPEATRLFCRDVSVWERDFSSYDAQAVARTDPAEHLEVLVDRDLCTVRGRRKSVRHRLLPLVREVAYRSLGEDSGPERHRRAAAHLVEMATGDPEERALHHERGGEPTAAAHAFADAAHLAIRRGDTQTALRTADRALALGVSDDARFELHSLRVDALRFLGEHDAQGQALEDALAAARGDRQRARALSEKTVWLWRRGRLDEALDAAALAVAAARASGDDESLALARGREFLVRVRAGQMAEAEEALAEAVRASASVDARLRATVLAWRAYHAAIARGLSERVAAYVELVDAYEALGDVRRMAGARANLADVYNRLGAFEAAAEALESAVEDCRRVRHRTMEGYSLANLAFARIGSGDAAAALALLDDAAEIARSTSEQSLALTTGVYRASALFALGRHERCVEVAESAASEAEERGLRDLAMVALAFAADAHLAMGEVDEALERSERALSFYDTLAAVEEGEAEVFVARVHALEAARREVEAEAVRERGAARMREIAGAIDDDELRTSFEAVAAVQALLAE